MLLSAPEVLLAGVFVVSLSDGGGFVFPNVRPFATPAASPANCRMNGLFLMLPMLAVSFCRSATSRSAAGEDALLCGVSTASFEGVPAAEPGVDPKPGFAGVDVTDVAVVGTSPIFCRSSPNSFHSSTCSRS